MSSAVSGGMVGTRSRVGNGPARSRIASNSKRVAGQRKHPAEAHGDLFTGSGILKFIEANRADAIRGSDGMAIAAETIRHAIRRSGHPMLLGLDKLRLARRLAKLIHHAAALEYEKANALTAFAAIYRGQIGEPGTPRAGRNRGLDPTK
jgi:hypothetical protein